MKKNKTKPKPKYAPIRNAARTANHSSSESREAAEHQGSQASDHGAEGEQTAHKMMKDHNCCYYNCPEPGTIHISPDGGDSHWICFRHLDRWNQNRARFLADGGGCEMEELPMTANEQNPATQPPFWTARAPHPGPDYPSDRGRMVYVEEIRIIASTQIAGSKGANRTDAIELYPKTVREQFPGRAVYRVRPIPEGELPAFIFMIALVCYQRTSDTTADLFELVVSWSSDDLDSSLPELIEREIRDIEWDWMARSKGRRTPADQP